MLIKYSSVELARLRRRAEGLAARSAAILDLRVTSRAFGSSVAFGGVEDPRRRSPSPSNQPAKYEPSGVAIATSCTNLVSFAISGAPIMIGTNQLPLEMEPTLRSDPLKEPDVRVAPHPAQHYEQTIFVSVM